MTPRGVASFRLDSELIEGLQAVWERDSGTLRAGAAGRENVAESRGVNVKSAPKSLGRARQARSA
jgi:hypothetical protein